MSHRESKHLRVLIANQRKDRFALVGREVRDEPLVRERFLDAVDRERAAIGPDVGEDHPSLDRHLSGVAPKTLHAP